jgi:hypothetical protein
VPDWPDQFLRRFSCSDPSDQLDWACERVRSEQTTLVPGSGGAKGGQYLLSVAGERFGLNRSPGSSSEAKKTRIYGHRAPPLIADC